MCLMGLPDGMGRTLTTTRGRRALYAKEAILRLPTFWLRSSTCAWADGTDEEEMEKQQGGVTNFWASLRDGPWGKNVAQRIETTLVNLAIRLASLDGIAALIIYGSYARGEAGRRSDLDLLVLFEEAGQLQREERETLALISQAEAEARLPVHISPLLVSLDHLEGLGDELLHALSCEGVILHGHMAALSRLLPQQPTPAVLITFSLQNATPAARMRLNRRLHGYTAWRTRKDQRKQVTYAGLITPPARSLGPGVLLVPGERRTAVIEALEEAGAMYTETAVWLTS